MTERLYHTNSRLKQFTSRIVEVLPKQHQHAVILDATAFYPTGGGQPHDTGWLGQARVVDVIEQEETGAVWHIVEGAMDFRVGDSVTGVIDWARRFDHMQQHSGQHILSQAFVKIGGIETKSFHLGAESSTIDLEWDRPDETVMRQAEDLANRIIFENRPTKIHHVRSTELSRFPIRRDTYKGDMVRIIEFSDFDFSPCCGTHVEQTGEIGLAAIRGWERVKKMCRVEFVCGARALRDYRAANGAAKAIAQMLTVGREQAPEQVARLLDENKQQRRRIRALLELAAEAEAESLLQTADSRAGRRLVSKVFDDRALEEATVVARKLCDRGNVVALFGVVDRGAGRLLFARSADMQINMAEWIKRVTERFGGRGGGSPEWAQGSIAQASTLAESLSWVVNQLDESWHAGD